MKLTRWAFLHSFWVQLACRLVLGAVFIHAALPKIADPPAFAKAIYTYKLFPLWTIHPFALFLPWLELLSGALVAIGIWVRAASAWLGVLLCAFIVAIGINLARQHPIDCGCFGVGLTRKTQEQKLNDMRGYILRDLGLLALAGIAFWGARAKSPEQGSKG